MCARRRRRGSSSRPQTYRSEHDDEHGASHTVVGHILNHAERGVTAVYDRYSYDAEKRAALNLWSERLVDVVR